VELMFPIDDPALASFVYQESLENAFKDNVGSRILHADGTYTRLTIHEGEQPFEGQAKLIQSRARNIQSIKHAPREFPQKN
jgi:polyphosphate kinase